jgi:hypothetical protein
VAGSVAIDETPIRNAITDAILDRAREIAEGGPAPLGTTFQLGQAHQTKITGYETPQSSLVAISFEASFDLEAIIVEDGTETHEQGTMRLNGGCSYDPIAKEVSEIEVKEWFKSLRNWGAGSADRVALERQYDPGRTRPIS